MKKAFREAYNKELALLYERSREFAADYPGIADRLGGLIKENLDPAVAGLLEGTAFMAARVQLKMDEEFRTFSQELLNQIFPDALTPTPSVMLVRANPPFDNKDLIKGLHFARGDYLDARFADADQRVSCRFSLCGPLSIWPLTVSKAVYHASPAPILAAGEAEVAQGTKAGLQLTIHRPASEHSKKDGGPISEVAVDSLPVYLINDMPDAVALYEQIFCDCKRASLRYLDKNGDPVFIRLAPDDIEQVGFEDDASLFPHDGRLFQGFARLREVFVFPRKLLGFRLKNLQRYLPRIVGAEVQLMLEFGTSSKNLAARLGKDAFALNCVPAVNLFEESASQIRLDDKRTEFAVTPDSSPLTHYEVYNITAVHAHYPGVQDKVRVNPLYAVPKDGAKPRQSLYYTTRQKPRRMTQKERRFGARQRYLGTETFISIYEPPPVDGQARAERLQVRTRCSNRHLPEYLPIADSRDDFHMCDDVSVSLGCVAGPTPPRHAMTELENNAAHRMTAGDNYWRLISYLSLSHFSLEGDDDGEVAAGSLREMLSLFADLSDVVTETQLQGIKSVTTRPIVRSIQRGDGYHPARGLEIRVQMDEAAFEGSGIILLGAALDRFLAEYAAVNSFTQTIIASTDRGDVAKFPPRTGAGPLI
ncbi:type VI secretion system baseplate subunit TssF [Yoonia sp. 2307UL14-13]|uniref:type VI secretion system baseplate subunit TssF n=1 Tax=Yoonia sp. 2307UL14-13 TaxID=3126506 RepID=UPI0030B0CF63